MRALPALLIGTVAVAGALPLQAAREAVRLLCRLLWWLLPWRLLPGLLQPSRAQCWAPRPCGPLHARAAAPRAASQLHPLRRGLWVPALAYAAAALVLVLALAWITPPPPPPPPHLRDLWLASGEAAAASRARIAVIGAGVGGAFVSDALRALGPNLQVDVYEASARVGGRALDTTVLGEPAHAAVELGASMFIGDNRLMVEAAASLGLRTSCRHDDAQERVWYLLPRY